MRSYPHTVTAPPPQVFNYSLDWRFWLPQEDPKKVCLLLEENADFRETLDKVGLHDSKKISLSDLRDHGSDRFHVMVMPFGLPVGWSGARHEEPVELYASLRRFIDSGGYLLVGFNNALNWHSKLQTSYHSSRPRRIADELKQAGFQSIKTFGVMPNLSIPEYMFDLNSRTIQFALQNRFRRKPAVLRALRVVGQSVGWKRMSNFLPCYFAVAIA